MNCKKIKQIISTDYIDGQLDESLAKQVQAHLSACEQCRLFEESLRRFAVEPFKNIGEIRPPDSVWSEIKKNIAVEQSQEGFLAYLKNYLRALFNTPKPVFAAIATTIFIITIAGTIISLSLSSEAKIDSYFQEQAEFLVSLETNGASNINSSTTGYNSLGTVIEEYFL